jgi:hypothetical protein
MTHLIVTVDSQDFDEPEQYLTEDGPQVRLAVASWQQACEDFDDGSVEIAGVADGEATMTEQEFVELAADAIACDAEEAAEIRAAWGRGEVWRRAE